MSHPFSARSRRGTSPLLIQADHLDITLDGAPILSDVAVSIRGGEMVGLIGPNGAGKTTLIRALGGHIKPSAGSVALLGRPLTAYPPREIARLVAHVPQATAMDFAFTVREVVLMGRSPHLGRFQIEQPRDRRIADEAMQRVQIEGLAERLITTLSGGERQRVFIARALAQQPQVLLLDEPTANLDVKHQLDVLEMTAVLVHDGGLGVLAAIHDLDLAARFCDRLVLLHEGRVLADDTPGAVLTEGNLQAAFEVKAHVFRDPYSDELRLSLSRNGHPVGKAEAEQTHEAA